MKLATKERTVRFAIWQNGPVTSKNGLGIVQTLYSGRPVQLRDHWGKPIIFETFAAASEFLTNPPAMVGAIGPEVFIHPTNSTARAGNPRGISFL